MNGNQTRNCTNAISYCYAGIKPEETQKCPATTGTAGTEEQNKTAAAISPESKEKFSGWLIWSLVIVVIAIVIVVVLTKIKHK